MRNKGNSGRAHIPKYEPVFWVYLRALKYIQREFLYLPAKYDYLAVNNVHDLTYLCLVIAHTLNKVTYLHYLWFSCS